MGGLKGLGLEKKGLVHEIRTQQGGRRCLDRGRSGGGCEIYHARHRMPVRSRTRIRDVTAGVVDGKNVNPSSKMAEKKEGQGTW